jgi:hypothetical protein
VGERTAPKAESIGGRVATVLLEDWPDREIHDLEDPAWGAHTPRRAEGPCDRTVLVELWDERTDRTQIVASWCGVESPLATIVGLIDGALAGGVFPEGRQGWTRVRIGRIAVLRGDPFGSIRRPVVGRDG